MFRFKNVSKILLSLLIASLAMTTSNSFADCTFNKGQQLPGPTEVNIRIPEIISMPANLEDNSVIHELTIISKATNTLTCTEVLGKGLDIGSELGPPPATGYTIPIKDTGMAIQLYSIESGSERPLRVWGEEKTQVGNVLATYNYFMFRLVKIGKIKHGAFIDPVKFALYKHGRLTTHIFKLVGNTSISTASCKTPDVSVNMGDYVASEISGSRGQSIPLKFNIDLNECQEGISKVTYSILANTPIIDQLTGLVSLDSNSTAKGVGLRIMDENGTALSLEKPYMFDSYDTNGGHFKIPLSASYVRLQDKELTVGTANTSLTFIMSYL
ncbi:fimbrial protein [Pseudomonas sp. LB3P14]